MSKTGGLEEAVSAIVAGDRRPQCNQRNVCISHISIFLSGLVNGEIYIWASPCVFSCVNSGSLVQLTASENKSEFIIYFRPQDS